MHNNFNFLELIYESKTERSFKLLRQRINTVTKNKIIWLRNYLTISSALYTSTPLLIGNNQEINKNIQISSAAMWS